MLSEHRFHVRALGSGWDLHGQEESKCWLDFGGGGAVRNIHSRRTHAHSRTCTHTNTRC